jgi:hypothetical protein
LIQNTVSQIASALLPILKMRYFSLKFQIALIPTYQKWLISRTEPWIFIFFFKFFLLIIRGRAPNQYFFVDFDEILEDVSVTSRYGCMWMYKDVTVSSGYVMGLKNNFKMSRSLLKSLHKKVICPSFAHLWSDFGKLWLILKVEVVSVSSPYGCTWMYEDVTISWPYGMG